MKQLLLIFIGGGAGSVLRYRISELLKTGSGFPYATLSVNIAGSLFLGFLIGFGLRSQLLSNNLYLLLATGFCGGFTTFSAFASENLKFLKAGDFYHLIFYGMGSLALGIAAVYLGLFISKII